MGSEGSREDWEEGGGKLFRPWGEQQIAKMLTKEVNQKQEINPKICIVDPFPERVEVIGGQFLWVALKGNRCLCRWTSNLAKRNKDVLKMLYTLKKKGREPSEKVHFFPK